MVARVEPLLRQIHRFAPDTSDAELVGLYAASRAGEPFRELVERHGSMVLRTCRGVLGDGPDAEDAFQATFLLLARKARSLSRPEAVGAWLHGAARRIALRARAARARRTRREAQAASRSATQPLAELTVREFMAVLDEEVARLPQRFRAPLLLCFWEGLTQDEAAVRLGWSPGSVKGRLERGRKRLTERLKRRGFGGKALLIAPLAAVAVSGDLLAKATAQTTGVVSPSVAALVPPAGGAWLHRALIAASVVVVGGISIAAVLYRPGPAPHAEPPAKPQAQAKNDLFGDPLPPLALARLGTHRFRSETWAQNIAVSPDRKTIAATATNWIILWDAASGREVRRLGPVGPARVGNQIHPVEFTRLAWSPDGRLLAAGTSVYLGDGKPVWLFDSSSGEKLREIRGAERHAEHLVFLDNQTLLTAAAAGAETEVRAWEAYSGKEIRKINFAAGTLEDMVRSADGRVVAIAGSTKPKADVRGVIELREWPSGNLILREAVLPPCRIALDFSPDGKTLAAGIGLGEPFTETGSSEIRLWDIAAKKERKRIGGPTGKHSHLVTVAFRPDGKVIAASGADDSVRQYAAETGQEIAPVIRPRKFASKVRYLDEKTLLTYWAQNTVRFWDSASGKAVRDLDGSESHLEAVAISPDGKTAATGGGGGDATVRLWDLSTGKQRLRIDGSMADITVVAFSPDGRIVAAADSSGVAHVWSASDGNVLLEIKAHTGWLQALAFSPDGRTLATGDDKATIRLWDTVTGQERQKLTGHEDCTAVRALVFTPDGQTLFSGGWDHSIRQWDLSTGKAIRIMKGTQGPLGADDSLGHTSVVTGLALTRDGRRLISSSYDHTIRILEVATGETCRRVKLPNRDKNSGVEAMSLSPDGSRLAVATEEEGRQNLVELWDMRSGKHLEPLSGHRSQVTRLAFSPDGCKLVSVSTDTTGLVWDVSAFNPAATRDNRAPAKLWDDLAAPPERAYDAVQRGVAGGANTLPLLREKLTPAAPVDARRIAELITALDSRQFADREKAARELAGLGSSVEPELRRALTRNPSAEVRKRLEVILDTISREHIRVGRAFEILEAIGSAEARALLADLAKGDPAAWQTHEAAAGLQRLGNIP
jgi:RNA polymerase sigma factor (sigma-70 family)